MIDDRYPQPKSMARQLRTALSERGYEVTHAEALELVARQFNCRDWNILSARLAEAPTDTQTENPTQTEIVPEGWFLAGRKDLYTSDLMVHDERPAIMIAARTAAISTGEFLTVMQRFGAEDFIGQRITFRAALRVENAIGNGRIWIRVDGNDGNKAIRFDNLGLDHGPNGPISGTTGWEWRHVTVDVPEQARHISMGVLLSSGAGRFWAADLEFGPARHSEVPRPLPSAPRNLALTAG